MKTKLQQIIFILFLASCSLVSIADCITLDCEYSDVTWAIGTMYTCTAQVIIDGDIKEVSDVSQNHMDGRNNSDVKAVLIYDQILKFAPRNIQAFFPHLQAFSLFNNTIEELTRDCLNGLENLRYFNFLYNGLQIIESDLFTENLSLEWIDFGYNPIRHVGYNAFEHLPLLQTLNFTLTTCISESAVDEDSVSLIKFHLLVRCPPTFEMTEKKIVNGNENRYQIDRLITDRVDPLIVMLRKLDVNQEELERRISVLEGAGSEN